MEKIKAIKSIRYSAKLDLGGGFTAKAAQKTCAQPGA